MDKQVTIGFLHSKRPSLPPRCTEATIKRKRPATPKPNSFLPQSFLDSFTGYHPNPREEQTAKQKQRPKTASPRVRKVTYCKANEPQVETRLPSPVQHDEQSVRVDDLARQVAHPECSPRKVIKRPFEVRDGTTQHVRPVSSPRKRSLETQPKDTPNQVSRASSSPRKRSLVVQSKDSPNQVARPVSSPRRRSLEVQQNDSSSQPVSDPATSLSQSRKQSLEIQTATSAESLEDGEVEDIIDDEEDAEYVSLRSRPRRSSVKPLGMKEMRATKEKARMALLQLRSQSVQCVANTYSSRRVTTEITHGNTTTESKNNTKEEEEDVVSRHMKDTTTTVEILQDKQKDVIKHLGQRITQLRRTFDAVKAEADTRERAKRQLKHELSSLQCTIAQEREDIGTLKENVDSMTVKMENIEHQNLILKHRVAVFRFMHKRTLRQSDDRGLRIAEIVDNIEILKSCQDECGTLAKTIVKECAKTVGKKKELQAAIFRVKNQYMKKLSERRELIGRLDDMCEYFEARARQREELKRAIQDTDSASLVGQLKSQLKNQAVLSIASIMSLKGQNEATSLQRLGTKEYSTKAIIENLRQITEKTGYKVTTPQELLEWVQGHKDITNNLAKESMEAETTIRRLNERMQDLQKELTLMDQKVGSHGSVVRESAYEELHRKIIQEKNKKEGAYAKICKRQSILATISVASQALKEKVETVDLTEDWVHKLDTSFLFGARKKESAPAGKELALKTINETTGGLGEMKNDLCAIFDSLIDTIEYIVKLCTLGAKVGLANTVPGLESAAGTGDSTIDSSFKGNSVSNIRFNLLEINEPSHEMNVRIDATGREHEISPPDNLSETESYNREDQVVQSLHRIVAEKTEEEELEEMRRMIKASTEKVLRKLAARSSLQYGRRGTKRKVASRKKSLFLGNNS